MIPSLNKVIIIIIIILIIIIIITIWNTDCIEDFLDVNGFTAKSCIEPVIHWQSKEACSPVKKPDQSLNSIKKSLNGIYNQTNKQTIL